MAEAMVPVQIRLSIATKHDPQFIPNGRYQRASDIF
jgi:hypothetical protein